MRRRKSKNIFAKIVMSTLILSLISIVLLLVKVTFWLEGQDKTSKSVSASYLTLSPNRAHAELSNTVKTEDLLILVNKNNRLPDDYNIDLTSMESIKVASILIDDLNEMRNAARNESIFLSIRSSYRTYEEQETIFNNIVQDYVNQGNSIDSAEQRAEQIAARPGYSEHQTGLAIDFSLSSYTEKQTEMWVWLNRNAYKYGFILRYPENQEQITGYGYEPWHYRYVGKEHAKIIYDNGLLLEEYIDSTLLKD